MSQLLKSDGAVFLAENAQAQVIGFAEVSLRHDHVDGATISPVPYLEAWFVQEPFRGQGIGRLLLDAVEVWASSRGYTELASDAELQNTLSIHLHHHLGFTEIDRNVTFLKTLKGRARHSVRDASSQRRETTNEHE
jgi:aminoglycoside 6'-N-acetyltransferase I